MRGSKNLATYKIYNNLFCFVFTAIFVVHDIKLFWRSLHTTLARSKLLLLKVVQPPDSIPGRCRSWSDAYIPPNYYIYIDSSLCETTLGCTGQCSASCCLGHWTGLSVDSALYVDRHESCKNANIFANKENLANSLIT